MVQAVVVARVQLDKVELQQFQALVELVHQHIVLGVLLLLLGKMSVELIIMQAAAVAAALLKDLFLALVDLAVVVQVELQVLE
jgi:hypothetical protein